MNVNFGILDEILSSESVEAAVKYLVEKCEMTEEEARDFIKKYLESPAT